MMRLALPELRFDHALAAMTALLAALTVWPWLPQSAAYDAQAVPAKPPPAAAALGLPPLASFAAVVDRPLFTPSRRASAADKGMAGGATFAGRYRLLGLLTAGDQRRALLAEGPRIIELKEGDTIEGWSISRIEQDRLVLSSGAGEAVLTLRQAAAGPADGKPAR